MASTIVVGVDGSDSSVRALEWAVDEASRRGSEVDALLAFTYSAVWGAMPEVLYVPPDSFEIVRKEAEKTLDGLVEPVAARSPEVRINRIVVAGPPVRTLLEAARGAELLVVGSRGLGGFRGLMLGSVSHQCVSHAPCPVVVLPAHEPQR